MCEIMSWSDWQKSDKLANKTVGCNLFTSSKWQMVSNIHPNASLFNNWKGIRGNYTTLFLHEIFGNLILTCGTNAKKFPYANKSLTHSGTDTIEISCNNLAWALEATHKLARLVAVWLIKFNYLMLTSAAGSISNTLVDKNNPVLFVQKETHWSHFTYP